MSNDLTGKSELRQRAERAVMDAVVPLHCRGELNRFDALRNARRKLGMDTWDREIEMVLAALEGLDREWREKTGEQQALPLEPCEPRSVVVYGPLPATYAPFCPYPHCGHSLTVEFQAGETKRYRYCDHCRIGFAVLHGGPEPPAQPVVFPTDEGLAVALPGADDFTKSV